MATTPSPRGRVHTPPTPLHGARYDDWQPYSPRRSSRVAAQRKQILPRSPQSRVNRASTPKGRVSHATFSPPASPTSPDNGTSLKVPKTRKQTHDLSPRSAQGRSKTPTTSDIDNSHPYAGSSQLHPTITDPFTMLPTPAKTPRKRQAPSDATLKSTARVLFPGRPVNVDDAMPTPRKARKGKTQGFSISSLVEEGDDEASSQGIQIYTDSKERVPSVGAEDENPFLSKNSAGKRKASTAAMSKLRQPRKSQQAEEAYQNDDGIIYVL